MKRSLVYYGSESLVKTAKPVTDFGPGVYKLIDEMFDTLSVSKGIGLAAPQVGVSKRVIIIDLSDVDDGPRIALVNPDIVWFSEEQIGFDEGCLSVPGIYCDVIRPEKIKISAVTAEGKPVTFEADGIFARVLQHEIDHLNGVLFIDRIKDEDFKEFLSELKKIKKLNKPAVKKLKK